MNMFHPGYSKKPLHVHNDIVFSCIARVIRDRGKLILKAFLLCQLISCNVLLKWT